jgi:hypothetical protein
MSERRGELRMAADKSAEISFNGGSTVVGCRVVDLSLDGACLEVARPADIPEMFDLIFEGYRTISHCRVKWRTGTRLGVAFQIR